MPEPPSDEEWRAWLEELGPERESLLLHYDSIEAPSSAELLQDLSRAKSNIWWADLLERLRDIHSPYRLFMGFEKLQRHYFGDSPAQTKTIPPIALIAVSLNNHAVAKNLPYKFCWEDIGCGDDQVALYMAFNAWDPKAKLSWQQGTSSQRVKTCSILECSTLESAPAIKVPYYTRDEGMFKTKNHSMGRPTIQPCLVWVSSMVKDKEKSEQGELLLTNPQLTAFSAQCSSSIKLFELLHENFRYSSETKKWIEFRDCAFNAIQRAKRAKASQKKDFLRKLAIKHRKMEY